MGKLTLGEEKGCPPPRFRSLRVAELRLRFLPPGPFSNLLGPFPLPKKVGEETNTHGSPPGVRAGLAVPPEQVPVAMERSMKGSGHNRWQLQVRMMRPLPGVWD